MKKLRIAYVVIGCTAILIKGIRDIRETRKETVVQLDQINQDMRLDIVAIQNAGEAMNERINNGEVGSIDDLVDAFRTEIAFNKIAVREDPRNQEGI